MTVSLNLANVSNAIASISISGVTVKDKDDIAGSWVSLPNVLYPNPDGWITNFNVDFTSFSRGSSASMNISYSLNYRFLGVAIGDISIFPSAYSALVDKLILIVNAIVVEDAPYNGSVDMGIGAVEIGPRQDPAGNNYFGADIQLNIVEMQNP